MRTGTGGFIHGHTNQAGTTAATKGDTCVACKEAILLQGLYQRDHCGAVRRRWYYWVPPTRPRTGADLCSCYCRRCGEPKRLPRPIGRQSRGEWPWRDSLLAPISGVASTLYYRIVVTRIARLRETRADQPLLLCQAKEVGMVAMDKGSSGDLTQHNGLTKSQSCGLAFRTLLQSVH
jgi:hypothetical protein